MSIQASLDHLVLLVSDMETSAAWYDAFTELVGFRKTRNHVYLHADGWAIDLRDASSGAQPYGRFNVGLNHFGLRVEDEKSVLALREAFAEKGFKVPKPQNFTDEVTAVFFNDPDGVRWEVSNEIGAIS